MSRSRRSPIDEEYQRWARENGLLHAIHIEHYAAMMVREACGKLSLRERRDLPGDLRAAVFLVAASANYVEAERRRKPVESGLLRAIGVEHGAAKRVLEIWEKLSQERREALPGDLRGAVFVVAEAADHVQEEIESMGRSS